MPQTSKQQPERTSMTTRAAAKMPSSVATTEASTSTATLHLIPISKAACRTHLENKGVAVNDPRWLSCVAGHDEEYNIPRNSILLKLCESSDGDINILDVDDDSDDNKNIHCLTQQPMENSRVKHARRYHDGSIAAVALLGRSDQTGITWTVVSRALCDVSLARCSSNGSSGEVLTVDDNAASGARGLNNRGSASNKSGTALESRSNQQRQYTTAAWLSMRKAPRQHGVFLDGQLVQVPIGRQVPVKDGSILSLYGPTGFAYQIRISHNVTDLENTMRKNSSQDNNAADNPYNVDISKSEIDALNSNNSKKRKNPPSSTSLEEDRQQQNSMSNQTIAKESSPHQQTRQRAHQLMIGECTCAMCMDILVKSTFAYPCGHAFCGECADSIPPSSSTTAGAINCSTNKAMCPTCRGQVQGWMSARSFDTMVWATALQGCLDRDDAQYYLERREKCGEDAPSAHELKSILNLGEDDNSNFEKGNNRVNGLHVPQQTDSRQPIQTKSSTLIPNTQQFFLSSSNTYNGRNMNNNGNTRVGVVVPKPPLTTVPNPTFFGFRRGGTAEDAICLE